MLWYYYFIQNENLLKVIERYDVFNDAKRGNSLNCQADVISMIKEYGMQDFYDLVVQPFEARFELYEKR